MLETYHELISGVCGMVVDVQPAHLLGTKRVRSRLAGAGFDSNIDAAVYRLESKITIGNIENDTKAIILLPNLPLHPPSLSY